MGSFVQEYMTRRAGWKEWVGLTVLVLPVTLLTLDASVLFLAAAHIGADLEPSSFQLLWVPDIYGFLIAGFLVTVGTLGDRTGRRKLSVFGAAASAVGLLLSSV